MSSSITEATSGRRNDFADPTGELVTNTRPSRGRGRKTFDVNDIGALDTIHAPSNGGIISSRKRSLEADDEVDQHPKRAKILRPQIEQQKQVATLRSNNSKSVITRRHRADLSTESVKQNQDAAPLSSITDSAISQHQHRPEIGVEAGQDRITVSQRSNPYSYIDQGKPRQQNQPAVSQNNDQINIRIRRGHPRELELKIREYQTTTSQRNDPYSYVDQGKQLLTNQTAVPYNTSPYSMFHRRQHCRELSDIENGVKGTINVGENGGSLTQASNAYSTSKGGNQPQVIDGAKGNPCKGMNRRRGQVEKLNKKGSNLISLKQSDKGYPAYRTPVGEASAADAVPATVTRKSEIRVSSRSTILGNIKEPKSKETPLQQDIPIAGSSVTFDVTSIRNDQGKILEARHHAGEPKPGLGPENNLIGNRGLIHEFFDLPECEDNALENGPRPSQPGQVSEQDNSSADNPVFQTLANTSGSGVHALEAQNHAGAVICTSCANELGTNTQEVVESPFMTDGEFDKLVDEWDLSRDTEYGVDPYQTEFKTPYAGLISQKDMNTTLAHVSASMVNAQCKAPLECSDATQDPGKDTLENTSQSFSVADPALPKATPDIPEPLYKFSESQVDPRLMKFASGPDGYFQTVNGHFPTLEALEDLNDDPGEGRRFLDSACCQRPVAVYDLEGLNDDPGERRRFLDSYYYQRPAAAYDLEEDVLLLRPVIEFMGAIPQRDISLYSSENS